MRTCRLELRGGRPSAVHETREQSQKDRAHHGSESRNDRSSVSAKARGAHEKPARHGSTDAHGNVHEWTVVQTLALTNEYGAPNTFS
jgi:formylglycine-generating enzyme required for sulfatase activity